MLISHINISRVFPGSPASFPVVLPLIPFFYSSILPFFHSNHRSVACYDKKFQVFLDYTPRKDILQHPDYYDQYFQGIDEELYQITKPLIDFGSASPTPSSVSVLSRLLTSPFATSLDIPFSAPDAGAEAAKIVKTLCEAHVR
jgi:hypothetical protein